MTPMKKWSDAAWEAAEPVFQKILAHPFIEELSTGTLSEERFRYYLRQDALYLAGYARLLAHIASRLGNKSHVEAFLGFATDGIAVERALHESFLGSDIPTPDQISPACLLYTSVLQSQALAPVEVEAAAILPCFWVYQRVGEAILARQQGGDANPYARWIATYGDPAFAAATARAVAICDGLAEGAAAETRAAMTAIFVRCTRMEWLFWESAWQLEQWKI